MLRVHSKEYLNFVQDLASSIECPEPFTPKVQRQLRSDPEHQVSQSVSSTPVVTRAVLGCVSVVLV